MKKFVVEYHLNNGEIVTGTIPVNEWTLETLGTNIANILNNKVFITIDSPNTTTTVRCESVYKYRIGEVGAKQ